MDTKFKEQMKQSLINLKSGILRQIAAESDEFRDVIESMVVKDLADVAEDDVNRRLLEALSTQDVNRLQAIEAALSRLENGHYGFCGRCGKKIPTARLEAIPYAILCVECKSADERRNR